MAARAGAPRDPLYYVFGDLGVLTPDLLLPLDVLPQGLHARSNVAGLLLAGRGTPPRTATGRATGTAGPLRSPSAKVVIVATVAGRFDGQFVGTGESGEETGGRANRLVSGRMQPCPSCA